MIAAIIFVLGIGCDSIPITDTVSISGLALAAIAGIILAFALPVGKDNVLE
jgi:uracil permease